MTLADFRRPLFACRMIYRSSPAVVLGRPPPTFLTAVPVVWNAFQARETTLLLIPKLCSYTGDGIRPSSNFPIILPRVKSSRSTSQLKKVSRLRMVDLAGYVIYALIHPKVVLDWDSEKASSVFELAHFVEPSLHKSRYVNGAVILLEEKLAFH
ncbi:structural maintenance of chromosomes protein 2-2 [Trichonephila clavipes]|nr:structural maintenance of chromosomes protein 2-2 [Trichonephila clavipes]